MKLIVCGGRDFEDYGLLIDTLDRIHKKKPITMVIEGGQSGADAHAAIWAENNKISRVTCFPNWHKHGNAAGPIRNRLMIELGAEGVVAFPGGKGTANMVMQARNVGLKVMEVTF